MSHVAFDPPLLDAEEVSYLLVVAMVDRRCIDIVGGVGIGIAVGVVVVVTIGADADADAAVVGFTVLVIN